MTGKLLTEWLSNRKRSTSHRQLLMISGDYLWCEQHLSALLKEISASVLVLTDTSMTHNQAPVKTSKISQYKQCLGNEFDCVVYNAFDGVKPNALYAMEGAIARSGLLVIVCPTFADWPRYEATKQGIAFTYQQIHASSRFLSRFIKFIHKSKSTAIVSQSNLQLPFDYVDIKSLDRESFSQRNPASLLQGDDAGRPKILTDEQCTALTTLTLAMQQKRSISLIKAKRGRGKTTILAHLAWSLVKSAVQQEVFITAPHVDNTYNAKREFNNLRQHEEQTLTYIAPDQLFKLNSNALVLIDEAAAIAPSILLYACHSFAHIIMATTVSGYEGSGLGFKLRVLPELIKIAPNFSEITLNQALRWFPSDSLELVFSDIFAPFNELSTQITSKLIENKARTHHLLIDKQILIDNEHLIQQVFGLLIQSHYQTTPDDLMRIIDAEDHHIFISTSSPCLTDENLFVVAVAVVVDEGKLTDDDESQLLLDIEQGSRRVKGHLVAQNLTTTLCNATFLIKHSWRVSRIAVSPTYRRLGNAERLLSYIKQVASARGLDYLSTSFGLTDSLLAFWRKQGYVLIRVGARRDTSSGEHSGIMILSLSKTTVSTLGAYIGVLDNDMQYTIAHIIQENMPRENTRQYKTILNEHLALAREVLQPSSTVKDDITLALMITRAKQFVKGQRSFTNVASTAYYFSRVNDSRELHRLFLLTLLKNRSKAQKQEDISNVKLAFSELLKLHFSQ